jgi:hypothetical protein
MHRQVPLAYLLRRDHGFPSGTTNADRPYHEGPHVDDSHNEEPHGFIPAPRLRGALSAAATEAQFGRVTFGGGAWFNQAIFSGDAGFSDAAFNGFTWFGGAAFHGRASFDNAFFRGGAAFREATFSSWASFGGATFNGGGLFDDATFHEDKLYTSFFKSHVSSPDIQHVWPKGWCIGETDDGGHTVVRADSSASS